jgi:hypothetical protein
MSIQVLAKKEGARGWVVPQLPWRWLATNSPLRTLLGTEPYKTWRKPQSTDFKVIKLLDDGIDLNPQLRVGKK